MGAKPFMSFLTCPVFSNLTSIISPEAVMTVPVPNVLCRTVSPGANTSAAFAASGRRCSTLGAGAAERWRCEVPLPNVDGFLPASGLESYASVVDASAPPVERV